MERGDVTIREDNITFDFGIRLRDLRIKRDLTQKEVAGRLEVHPNTISGYENNTIVPPLDNLIKLAVLYNSSVDFILGLNNRSNLFIDELPIGKQKMMSEIFESVRKEYESSINESDEPE